MCVAYFINADQGDQRIAHEIRDQCLDKDFLVILSMTEGTTGEK